MSDTDKKTDALEDLKARLEQITYGGGGSTGTEKMRAALALYVLDGDPTEVTPADFWHLERIINGVTAESCRHVPTADGRKRPLGPGDF